MSIKLRGRWFIFLSLMIVPLLQVWPLSSQLMPWRPAFPVVIVAFWAYTAPRHIGVTGAFVYGVFVELLSGANTAQWALPCALLVLFIEMRFTYLHSFTLPQQAAYICLALFVVVLSGYLVSHPYAGFEAFETVWRTTLSSILCWFLLILGLEPISRHYVAAGE